MDYEQKFKNLLKRAGFKMDGPYVEIDGHQYAVHIRPLKKKPESGKVVQESKEELKQRKQEAMLESVRETAGTGINPSDVYAKKGFEKTGASGVLIALRSQGLIEKLDSGWQII